MHALARKLLPSMATTAQRLLSGLAFPCALIVTLPLPLMGIDGTHRSSTLERPGHPQAVAPMGALR